MQWTTDGLVSDGTVTTAIPPLFAAYGTIAEPDREDPVDFTDNERAVVEQLTKHGSWPLSLW